MKLIVQKETLDRLTKEELPLVGRTGRNYYSLDTLDVSLLAMTNEDIDKLRQAFRRVIEEDDDRHAPTLVRDIDQWFSVLNGEDAGGKRPRSLQQFSSLLTEYLRNVPGHRVYMRSPWSNGWLGYYVNTIDYHPPVKERDWYQPAYVTMDLLSYHLDKIEQTTITFKSEDTDRRTIARSLVDMGVLPETKDLRDAYLYYNEMYDNTFGKVGLQHQVYGFAMPMSESRRDRNNRVFMDVDGSPAKVVVDVVSEDGPRQDNNRDPIRRLFWASKVPSKAKAEDNRDELVGNVAIAEGREGENEAQEESAAIEIPVHPYVVVYDLERHKRFLVHVDDLEVYTFDTNLGDNLILPATTKDLIDTLVSQGRVSFRDIMEGRGSGACVLLGGPPGVGKSLSALVYAEATERPLLTVHAAQLGVDADDIEKNLTLYMRRASRWNAVMLLDEADVYIRERSSDLQQNAIVAAFLRVLENHTSTLFMTTNRLDTVDDAIISRCIARIDYDPPSVENQRKIWQVLDRINGTGLTEGQIGDIVLENDDLTGRDIKQLLKLASLWTGNQGGKVTPETIGFVRRFLPTKRVFRQNATERALGNGVVAERVPA